MLLGAFEQSPEKFPVFFADVLKLCLQESEEISLRVKRSLLLFMINCFQSLENPLVRSECMRYGGSSTLVRGLLSTKCKIKSTHCYSFSFDLGWCHYRSGTLFCQRLQEKSSSRNTHNCLSSGDILKRSSSLWVRENGLLMRP
jgi:hypothetical protein